MFYNAQENVQAMQVWHNSQASYAQKVVMAHLRCAWLLILNFEYLPLLLSDIKDRTTSHCTSGKNRNGDTLIWMPLQLQDAQLQVIRQKCNTIQSPRDQNNNKTDPNIKNQGSKKDEPERHLRSSAIGTMVRTIDGNYPFYITTK